MFDDDLALDGTDGLSGLLDRFEARADLSFARDRELELADRSRTEYRSVPLAGRLLASVGGDVTLLVGGAGTVDGVLERVAADWVEVRGSRSWIVRRDAVESVVGASDRSLPEAVWPASAVLGVGSPLRELAAEGGRVRLHLVDGGHYDGTLLRIGADFAEVAVGMPPHDVLVSFEAIAAVSVRM